MPEDSKACLAQNCVTNPSWAPRSRMRKWSPMLAPISPADQEPANVRGDQYAYNDLEDERHAFDLAATICISISSWTLSIRARVSVAKMGSRMKVHSLFCLSSPLAERLVDPWIVSRPSMTIIFMWLMAPLEEWPMATLLPISAADQRLSNSRSWTPPAWLLSSASWTETLSSSSLLRNRVSISSSSQPYMALARERRAALQTAKMASCTLSTGANRRRMDWG